eukprot:TRINITY_DN4420_c0_g1_i1.p1 TRINITY_DN4420_c0_g1~~TRINITY_DN4420_c0_g1_i1.p1  ORF type:complete len:201 (-),score=65.26 TRINITY_DN4420_c0_g1_i1:7-549(-)
MALTSFFRAYKEHRCKFVFKSNALSPADVVYSFGLLHLPRMPETKTAKSLFNNDPIRDRDIPYLDKTREESRLLRLEKFDDGAEERNAISAQRKKEKDERLKINNTAFSNNKAVREKKLNRKEKNELKRERIHEREWRERLAAKEAAKDLADLEDDYRELKKKKKKRGRRDDDLDDNELF